MGNNELLLAISDMMDKKLDCINVRMDRMEERLGADIQELDSRLSANIQELDSRLSAEIRKVNVTMENVVIPRLRHMEQCYLDASERYIKETGRINGLTADVQVIKSVMQEHSEKLKKIS